ncbi:MarR family transcriptional regulator [Brevibacterium ammoniilyticum]|uniref:MarR family transcriptional regulator n=2 Tax=Brevibacterium TaxID=1696 RepID=A0ABP9U1W5_9MICO
MYPEFFRLVRRMQQRHAQLWAAGDIPITRVQFVALRTLVGKPGIEPVELARLLEIDKATLAGVLSRLEATGNIRREVVPSDRRRRLLFVTDAGRKLVADFEPVTIEINRRLFAPVSESQMRELLRLISYVADEGSE